MNNIVNHKYAMIPCRHGNYISYVYDCAKDVLWRQLYKGDVCDCNMSSEAMKIFSRISDNFNIH
jgi:hypothetical protein